MEIKTRFQDAASIVGEEFAKQTEEKLQRERKDKSSIPNIIYKSELDETLVDKITENLLRDLVEDGKSVIKSDLAEWEKLTHILKPDHFPMLFYKLDEMGKITTDEMSNLIQTLINEISKSEVEKCEMNGATATPVNEEPFGGAKTLKEAQDYKLAQKIEWNAQNLYWDFQAIYGNIINDDDILMPDKIMAINSLITEFQKMMTPKTLAEMSITEKDNQEMPQENLPEKSVTEMDNSVNSAFTEKLNRLESLVASLLTQPAKVENEVTENLEVKSLVSDFSNDLNNAVNKSVNERKQFFQDMITDLGAKLEQLHYKLGGQVVENKTSLDLSQIGELVERSVADKFNSINTQLNSLAELVKSQNSQVYQLNNQVNPAPRPIPQMKSITSFTAPPTQNSKGMSISEIARRTTIGR